jgi:hypothetical protein
MDRTTQSYFEDLQAEVRTYNMKVLIKLWPASQEKVGWAYEVKYKKKYAAVWKMTKTFEGKCR